MFDIVKVIEASPAGEYRLRLAFSDGSSGELAALRSLSRSFDPRSYSVIA